MCVSQNGSARFAWLTVCLVFGSAGCSCTDGLLLGKKNPPPPGCSDEDGDGFGVGAECTGPDCNDWISDVHSQEECDAWCESHSDSPGCPCEGAEPTACYLGPPQTIGVGTCVAGLMTCTDGLWGACVGQVVPVDERCDADDDDCDGVVDDGPDAVCGACAPCERGCAGAGCGGWGEPLAPGLALSAGHLTLGGITVPTHHLIWPSSSGSGELFRVDTRTREIEAAFWTGPNHGADNNVSEGDSPSRTAVDDLGNVYIANRAFAYVTPVARPLWASMTKVAADPETCPDLNGNGRVDTSTGWDDKLPFDRHEHWEDECILWHTVVGDSVDHVARAMALQRVPVLDGAFMDRGWVGIFVEERYLELDAETGALTGVTAPTPGCTPYGAAIDRDGWLWSTCLANRIGRFDTANPADTFETLPLPAGDGKRVLIDENNAPWISGTGVFRWNRADEQFQGVVFPPEATWGVGTFASDGKGSIWLGQNTVSPNEWIYRISNDETPAARIVPTPSVRPFGVAVDFEGQVWGFDMGEGRTVVVDPETETSERIFGDCGGRQCLDEPYVRGDITGVQRRNAQMPMGIWSKVFEGCGSGGTDWKRVRVEGTRPDGTEVVVSARTADTVAELPDSPWIEVGRLSPGGLDEPLDVPNEPFLEVRLVLESTDRAHAPVLSALEVLWACPNLIR